jgi:hypothetical protein
MVHSLLMAVRRIKSEMIDHIANSVFAGGRVLNESPAQKQSDGRHMAKHKSSIYLPPSPPPPSPPPPAASRLVVQLLTTAGELVIFAACVLGIVTAGSWMIAGADLRSRSARQLPPPPREVWHCWWDRRYGGNLCEPPYRLPPGRRYFMRDHV